MIKKTHPKPGYRHLHMHYLVLAQDGAALEWTVNPTATASWVYLSQVCDKYFAVIGLVEILFLSRRVQKSIF